jgi:hypothetical protein
VRRRNRFAGHGQDVALVQIVCPASVQQFDIGLPSPHSQHALAGM